MRLEYVIKYRLFTKKWRDGAKSNLEKWNLIVEIQFKQVKKLPNVHEEQWLGMFWLDFGRCFHGT